MRPTHRQSGRNPPGEGSGFKVPIIKKGNIYYNLINEARRRPVFFSEVLEQDRVDSQPRGSVSSLPQESSRQTAVQPNETFLKNEGTKVQSTVILKQEDLLFLCQAHQFDNVGENTKSRHPWSST